PEAMSRVLPEATQRALAPVAEEARTRLSRALSRL
ncbi:MAG: ABC transporter ATP-binding protein, partial [Thermus sp.]